MRWCFALLLLFTLTSAPTLGQDGANDIEQKLARADEVRTANRQEFLQLLTELETHKSQFSHAQQDFYQYLHIYKDSLNGNYDIGTTIGRMDELYKQSSDKVVRFRILSSIVNLYAIKRDFYQGSLELTELFKQAEVINDPQLILHRDIVASIFYSYSKQYELALALAEKLMAQPLPPRKDCFTRSLWIDAAANMPSIKIEEAFFEQTITLCNQINEKIMTTLSLANMAKQYLSDQQHEQAYQLLSKNWRIAEGIKYPAAQGEYYAVLSQAALATNNLVEAERYALFALEHSKNYGYVASKARAIKTLATVYAKYEEWQKAYDYEQEYQQAEKAYQDATQSRQLAIQRAQYEAKERDAQISLLTAQNALAKQQAENDRLALAMVTLALIAILFWAYKHRSAAIKLKVLAEKDELTGVANRNHFNQEATQALANCQKHQQAVAYILFDLDLFKQVNDNYGHPTGDWALKEAVKAAHASCRSNDIIGRMGGEEFAILLPNCTTDKAQQVADKCRKAIENTDSAASGYQFTITASFGVTDTNRCNYDIDKLYACADAAMYCAKDKGRNKVCLFEADMLEQQPSI